MPAHVSDFSKTPKQIVLDLINADNGSSLTDVLVSLGLPTVATGETPLRNTELTVFAEAGSGYSGSQVMQYDRLAVSGFPGASALTLPVGDAVNYSDLIPEINVALGINLTADDYIDGAIGAWAGTANETKSITITMNPDSLVFLGSLVLTLEANDIPLSSVITTTTLSGLNYPAA